MVGIRSGSRYKYARVLAWRFGVHVYNLSNTYLARQPPTTSEKFLKGLPVFLPLNTISLSKVEVGGVVSLAVIMFLRGRQSAATTATALYSVAHAVLLARELHTVTATAPQCCEFSIIRLRELYKNPKDTPVTRLFLSCPTVMKS